MEESIFYIVGGVILLGGFLLFIFRNQKNGNDSTVQPQSLCCGAHDSCSLQEPVKEKDEVEIVYFDDEELDKFRAKNPESYTQEEVIEFQEILRTIEKKEVADWLRSLYTRRIQLPPTVRQEAYTMIHEYEEV